MDDTVRVNLSGLDWGSAPGHHGYPRAAGLISCQAFSAVSAYRFKPRREDRSSILLIPPRRPRREALDAELSGWTNLTQRES
jgi:hypothetical protein